jgi:hypothetical protein
MKASALIKGRRAIKRVKMPLANAGPLLGSQPPELTAAQQEAGVLPSDAPDIGIRTLTAWEWGEVLRQASEFATTRGGKAEDTDELYQLGKMAYTLLVACVDPDDDGHGPFFDGGIDQILNSIDLGRDGIAYLYEQVEMWQDATSPQLLNMDSSELESAITELAGEEGSSMRFFTALRPGMQWRCARFMAVLLQSFLSSSFSSGGDSTESSKAVSSKPDAKRSNAKHPRRHK